MHLMQSRVNHVKLPFDLELKLMHKMLMFSDNMNKGIGVVQALYASWTDIIGSKFRSFLLF